jgi:TM2 domain-containing membrane protein YozV
LENAIGHSAADGIESSRGRTLTACALAWALPGAGHFYLGKRGKAAVFFAVVVLTFVLGLAMQGRVYLAGSEQPLSYLAAFANIGLGPLDAVGRQISYDRIIYRVPSPADRALYGEIMDKKRHRILAPTHEYGTTFILVASLMNILLILDAFDIGIGRKP